MRLLLWNERRDFTFTPPSVDEGLETTHPLFRYYKLRRGVTLLVYGTQVRAVQFPSQEDCANADRVYLGGHIYTIPPEDAPVLAAAGFGAYLT